MCAANTDSGAATVSKVVLVQRDAQWWVARSTDGTAREGTSRREALCCLDSALRDWESATETDQ